MKKVTRLLVAVATFALLAGQVSAEIISINYYNNIIVSNAPGQGVFDDSGTVGVWNNMQGTAQSLTNIVDSASNTTTVGWALGIGNTDPGSSVDLAVLSERAWLSGTKTFTLSGLTASQEYEMAFFGADASYPTVYTIGSTSVTNSADGGTTSWSEGGNYVTLTAVADASGVISGTLAPPSGSYSTISGLQIATIPEPATLGLVATLGGALLFLRRRFVV